MSAGLEAQCIYEYQVGAWVAEFHGYHVSSASVSSASSLLFEAEQHAGLQICLIMSD